VQQQAQVEKCAVEDLTEDGLSTIEDVFSTRETYNPHEYRWGDGAATIVDYRLVSSRDSGLTAVKRGAVVVLKTSIRFVSDVVRPILGFTIKTKEGVTLYNTNSELQDVGAVSSAGLIGDYLGISISFKASFAPGEYFISLGIASRRADGTIVPHDRRYDSIQMTVVSNEKTDFTGFFDIGAKMSASGKPGVEVSAEAGSNNVAV
jgi:lipopolysaccharide transport system ATP-binding protein